MGLSSMDPANVPAKFEVRIALPVPEIILAITVLGVAMLSLRFTNNVFGNAPPPEPHRLHPLLVGLHP